VADLLASEISPTKNRGAGASVFDADAVTLLGGSNRLPAWRASARAAGVAAEMVGGG
jgi:hypothetical protein